MLRGGRRGVEGWGFVGEWVEVTATMASFPSYTRYNPPFRDRGDRVALPSTGTVTLKQTGALTTSSGRNVKGGHGARQHCVIQIQRKRGLLPGPARCASLPGTPTTYERIKHQARQLLKETTGLQGMHTRARQIQELLSIMVYPFASRTLKTRRRKARRQYLRVGMMRFGEG